MEARNEALRSDVRANLFEMKADLKIDISQLRKELAERDKDNDRWTIGLVVASVVVVGIIIRWPAGLG